MDITPLIPTGRKIITGYGAGGFKINDEVVSGSLLVFPERVLRWEVAGVSDITESTLAAMFEGEVPELLLFGMGASIAYLPPQVRAMLKARGVAADVMDTGAACRTYNVLLSEERRVAAALIAV